MFGIKALRRTVDAQRRALTTLEREHNFAKRRISNLESMCEVLSNGNLPREVATGMVDDGPPIRVYGTRCKA